MGNWSDTYDSLNRLVSAKQTAAPPLPAPSPYSGDSLCWGYDPFGNRTAQSIQSTACPALPAQPAQTAFYNSANRSTSLDYDNSGDVGFDPTTGNQYLYDAEGRICAVAATPIPSMTVLTGYIYDAGGTRVAKGTITSWSCNPAINGFKTVNDYVLGLGGEQVTEMGVDTTAGSGTTTLAWQHTNVFAGGKLLGTYDKDGLHFYFDDPLGTRRAQTDYAGHLEQTCSSLPFGDQLACTGGDLQAPTEHHFTGKERDTESGNDYFEARYYSSAMGRFMSPDWSAKEEPVPYAKLDDPQSLNLYAYVRNNPLSRTDPDGHQEPQPPTITCTGTAYVLAGNTGNIGHEGAPGVTVTNGSAAVVPRQWTGADGMGPTLRTIGAGTTGTVTGPNGQKESFSTLTQPVGEATLGTAKQAQDTIMARAPGALVIEIVGGKDFGTKANVTLTMPNLGQSCPTGTTQVPAPKPAPTPAPAPAPTPPPPPVRPPAH